MKQTDNPIVILELLHLAQTVLHGVVPSLSDLRRIENLRSHLIHEDDPALFPIRAAASELDTIPSPSIRSHFSENFLASEDERCREYLMAATDEIKAACQRILSAPWLSDGGPHPSM